MINTYDAYLFYYHGKSHFLNKMRFAELKPGDLIMDSYEGWFRSALVCSVNLTMLDQWVLITWLKHSGRLLKVNYTNIEEIPQFMQVLRLQK